MNPPTQRESNLRTNQGIQLTWFQRRDGSYRDFWLLGESPSGLDAFANVYKVTSENHYRIQVIGQPYGTSDRSFRDFKEYGTAPSLDHAISLAETYVQLNKVL